MQNDLFGQHEVLLSKVFTPGTPVSIRELFAGRLEELRAVLDTVNRLGYHAIIYGERGVGKTSLANILPAIIAGPNDKPQVFSTRVNCDKSDDFTSVWKKVFAYLRASNRGMGFGNIDSQVLKGSVLENLPETLTPTDVANFLRGIPGAVIVIDEFDRLDDSVATSLFADLIKYLSDFEVNVTVILIGVADSVSALINEHQSIDRCTDQISFPRMSNEELEDVIKLRFPKANMSFHLRVPEVIARLSQGFPHYAHLLGLHSGRAALDAGRVEVTLEDVKSATKTAVDKSTASIQETYQTAVNSSHKDSLHEDVLLACALAEPDEFGYFVTSDVRGPLSAIEGEPYDISSFSGHLKDFCELGRGSILQRRGSVRKWKYRFTNPLMRPYVYLKGIARNRLPEGYSPL